MEKPEYLDMRCCMCPNINKNTSTCPGIPGTPHPISDPCRFVKTYADGQDNKYMVMDVLTGAGARSMGFGINMLKVSDPGWYATTLVPWNKCFDKVQSVLNHIAKERGWDEVN